MTTRVLQGDALERLRELPSGSVHCVVTSPPYYSLRRYAAGPQEMGSEATAEEHLARLVAVFREVKRVLRDDGTLWCNYGDAMPAGELTGLPERLVLALQADDWVWRSTVVYSKPAPVPESVSGTRWEQHQVKVQARQEHRRDGGLIRPSNVPGAHASASTAQAAVWAPCPGCPACVPNDGLVLRRGSWRPTRAWEPIFMLTKGGGYYADQEAIREPHAESSRIRASNPANPRNRAGVGSGNKGSDWHPEQIILSLGGSNPRNVWVIPPEPCNWDFCLACGTWYGKGGWQGKSIKRWTTQEIDEATGKEKSVQHRRCANCKAVDEFVDHYAAFPSELPRRCIAASTSERGVCPACGAPWARVVEQRVTVSHQGGQTLGWRATCACAAGEPVPATVLDPFMGSGTTLLAAARLGRDAIGIELSPRYVALAQERLRADAPLLAGTAPAGPTAALGGEEG